MTDRIAGRYERIERLGAGAHGEVWEARDVVSGRTVAVKLLRPEVDFSPARAQLEAAALRLRLPGVVELYDDGVDDGVPYLAMERVHGDRFPGVAGPCGWAQIADVTVALLETLAHVHAASVVHRDLKPANVLCTGERRIKVLDFGLALRVGAMSARLTQAPQVLGTPAYMAPEQVRGEADSRTDLFTVGVMLYEALAGRLPFTGDTLAEILRAQKQRPAPLAQAAPGVPPIVAQVVDRLLAYDPAERPRSAAEVLHMLRGEPSVEAPHFPWLGPQATLRALVRAVQAGRSVDVVGPRGSGRTRHLLALEQALGEGRRVVWTVPSEEAFASLAPLVGPLSEHHAASFEEVRALVKRQVRAALAEGAILMADDAEQLDRASASVLAACRGDGAVVRAFREDARPGEAHEGPSPRADDESIDLRSQDGEGAPASARATDTLSLAPLREGHLRSLFAGPDRLLHLREDAARVLHLRTEGLPARVTEEITRWVRLGLAHWKANHLVVSREVIDALESGLLLAARIEPVDVALPGVTGALADLLAWLGLAWPHTEVSLVARAIGQPVFRVEAHLATLAELGLVERAPDGRFVPRVMISAATRWTEDRLRAAHDVLARLLPPGTPGRLGHVWMRGARSDEDRRAIAAEAAALAERLVDEGRLEPAMAALERGMRQVRDIAPGAQAEVGRLLSLWVEAAIESGTPHALDRALHEICRAEPRTELVAHLELLCRAALGRGEFTSRPLERIEKVPPFEEPRLERARLSVRAQAARHLSDLSAQEAVLREIEAAVPAGDADAAAVLANHRGRLRYRQGRFREAAELHREAAAKARSAQARTFASLSASFAHADLFDFDEARAWAARAADLARAHRHAYHETLAEWTLRTIAYRQDAAPGPDLELVEAAAFVGVKQLEGLICLTEAAVAYRAGTHAKTAELARHAHDILSSIGEHQGALLSRALAIRVGQAASEAEITGLCEVALSPLMPGIGLQALSLLAAAGSLPPHVLSADQAIALAEAVPREHWNERMDVLSVAECLADLGFSPPGTPPGAPAV